MPLDVLIFVSPNPGKEQRVAEILTSLTEKVRAEEPYTLNYHSYKCQSEEMDLIDYVVYGRLVESGLLLFFQLTRDVDSRTRSPSRSAVGYNITRMSFVISRKRIC